MFEEKMCPYCAEIIKAEAILCRYCQSDVRVESTRPCPWCAELVKAEAKACKHCHRDILDNTGASAKN